MASSKEAPDLVEKGSHTEPPKDVSYEMMASLMPFEKVKQFKA